MQDSFYFPSAFHFLCKAIVIHDFYKLPALAAMVFPVVPKGVLQFPHCGNPGLRRHPPRRSSNMLPHQLYKLGRVAFLPEL